MKFCILPRPSRSYAIEVRSKDYRPVTSHRIVTSWEVLSASLHPKQGVPPISRASAGLMSKKTRPVHKKLRALIDLMVGGLCEVWEAPSETSLVLKLDRETHALTRARVKPDD